MVNTGKPSTGCYTCRARRIKCDEAKPQCMKCQKIKKPCPGYRNPYELKHGLSNRASKRKGAPVLSQLYSTVSGEDIHEPFNRGLAVITRVANFGSSAPHHPTWMGYDSIYSSGGNEYSQLSPDSTSSDRGVFSIPMWHQQISIPRQLPTSINEQAVCNFFSNFVFISTDGTMKGYLDFLIPLLPVVQPDSPLSLAFSACALVALGSRQNPRALLQQAEVDYVKALKRINIALRDPEQSKDDSTLAAILLLSVFEQLSPTRMKPTAFNSHIDGATALTWSRGKSQFQTPVGRRLGLTVRSHMVLSCIVSAKPIDGTTDFWMSIEAYDGMTQALDALNLELVDLRVETNKTTILQDRTDHIINKVESLLRKAEALEQKYIDWQNSLPPSWAVKTVAWVDEVEDLESSFTHPGRIDRYSDIQIAQIHNICRCSRLYTWSVILCCVAWLCDPRDYRITAEYRLGSHRCKNLITDIIASLPYLLGRDQTRDSFSPLQSNCDSEPNINNSIKGLSASCVMWPFFAAKNSDFASNSQVRFLEGRLKHMAEVLGIHQAAMACKLKVSYPSVLFNKDCMRLYQQVPSWLKMQVHLEGGLSRFRVCQPGIQGTDCC